MNGSNPSSPNSSTPRGRKKSPKQKQPHEEDIEMNNNISGNHNRTSSPLLKAKSSNLADQQLKKDETTKDGKITAAGWKAVTACFLYSFCSVSMILVNKSLASRYAFVNTSAATGVFEIVFVLTGPHLCSSFYYRTATTTYSTDSSTFCSLSFKPSLLSCASNFAK